MRSAPELLDILVFLVNILLRLVRRSGLYLLWLGAIIVFLDSCLPKIGSVYVPSRRSHQPKLPYGLSLVDVEVDGYRPILAE